MKKKLALAAFAALGLFGCSSSQVSATATAVQQACTDATQAEQTAESLAKGGALATVDSIAAYVNAGCSTATAIAALAESPSSVEWLGTLQGELSALAAGA